MACSCLLLLQERIESSLSPQRLATTITSFWEGEAPCHFRGLKRPDGSLHRGTWPSQSLPLTLLWPWMSGYLKNLWGFQNHFQMIVLSDEHFRVPVSSFEKFQQNEIPQKDTQIHQKSQRSIRQRDFFLSLLEKQVFLKTIIHIPSEHTQWFPWGYLIPSRPVTTKGFSESPSPFQVWKKWRFSRSQVLSQNISCMDTAYISLTP